MRTQPVTTADFRGVFPVPPLCRRPDGALDLKESGRVADHIAAGGVRNFLYGGNAFLYHMTLAEYSSLLAWMAAASAERFMIPSAGPSYGRAMDQAALLRPYRFPCTMLLPCADPRDAAGLERGYRDFADAAETKLIVYLKDETNFGQKKEAGLDAVARLVRDGVCIGIKYAVVRENPGIDEYLDALLARVPREHVISGIGERPAIAHLCDFRLPGFTTGSGCVAPALSRQLFERCIADDWSTAQGIREHFLALEDLRDEWGPARVLHSAVQLAGIAATGPIAPYISMLDSAQLTRLAPAAQALMARNEAALPVNA